MDKSSPEWRLYCAGFGLVAECIIEQLLSGTWLLRVRQGDFLTISEECETRDVAVRLSDQIWAHLRERGWIEVVPSDSQAGS